MEHISCVDPTSLSSMFSLSQSYKKLGSVKLNSIFSAHFPVKIERSIRVVIRLQENRFDIHSICTS